jgi:prephenate dehydrogenase
MATTANVAGESPELYYAIQKLNPYTARVHSGVADALREWTEWVARGEASDFAAAMDSARDWIAAGG